MIISITTDNGKGVSVKIDRHQVSAARKLAHILFPKKFWQMSQEEIEKEIEFRIFIEDNIMEVKDANQRTDKRSSSGLTVRHLDSD